MQFFIGGEGVSQSSENYELKKTFKLGTLNIDVLKRKHFDLETWLEKTEREFKEESAERRAKVTRIKEGLSRYKIDTNDLAKALLLG